MIWHWSAAVIATKCKAGGKRFRHKIFQNQVKAAILCNAGGTTFGKTKDTTRKLKWKEEGAIFLRFKQQQCTEHGPEFCTTRRATPSLLPHSGVSEVCTTWNPWHSCIQTLPFRNGSVTHTQSGKYSSVLLLCFFSSSFCYLKKKSISEGLLD